MAKTQLKTDWICIATAGATVDGRAISEQELLDMAESYDPEKYTALIWWEHYRFFNNLGQVLSLKSERVNGTLKLFAELRPTAELIELNQAGQKIFTSIEMKPNFANSGKTYLSGLAVTDSPASLGTSQLNFSAKGIKETDLQLGNHEPFHFSLNQNEPDEKGKEGFFAAFFDLFKRYHEAEQTTPPPISDNHNNNEENTPMDKEQFSQLLNAVNGLSAKIDEKFSQQPPPSEPEPKGLDATGEQVVSAQAFNDLKAQFDALEQKFNALAKTEVTPIPSGKGEKETQKFNMAV